MRVLAFALRTCGGWGEQPEGNLLIVGDAAEWRVYWAINNQVDDYAWLFVCVPYSLCNQKDDIETYIIDAAEKLLSLALQRDLLNATFEKMIAIRQKHQVAMGKEHNRFLAKALGL